MIGVVFLLLSLASTPVTDIQPENGLKTPSITTTASNLSSGGSYIRFNSTSGKRFTSTTAASMLSQATNTTQVETAMTQFLSQYNVAFQMTSITPSTYVTQFSTYAAPTNADLTYIKLMGSLFIDEWSKYPVSWVQNSQLQKIVFVKDFYVDSTYRAAMPDIVGKAVYYDIGYAGSQDYMREVIHHEYTHELIYSYYGAWNLPGTTWESYNTPGFTYGNGGASCYQPGNNCLTGQHPIPGFVTGYSASAIAEDQAEIDAYLMTTTYYHDLQSWLPGDPYLTNKINYYKQFMLSKSPEMGGTYYNDINP